MNKAILLFSLLPRYPLEFYDRVMTFLEVQLERLRGKPLPYETTSLEGSVKSLERALGREVYHTSWAKKPWLR